MLVSSRISSPPLYQLSQQYSALWEIYLAGNVDEVDLPRVVYNAAQLDQMFAQALHVFFVKYFSILFSVCLFCFVFDCLFRFVVAMKQKAWSIGKLDRVILP